MKEWSIEKFEEVQNQIEKENSKRTWYQKLKTQYLSLKYKLEDCFSNDY